MQDDPLPISVPTPSVDDQHDGIMHSPKEFSDSLTMDLTDDEIQQTFAVIVDVSNKYKYRTYSSIEEAENILTELHDEVSYRLMALGVLARLDTSPMLDGQPPAVEIIGKVPGTEMEKYGFDHEKKTWEVQKAKDRGEIFLGAREGYNKLRKK